ncbi:phage integrase family protein [Nocardiaceae bacterium YC2-7]|uniref:Phage integrase family protein n=1 Tax=Antrihabitans stalactiti TaxID=2584121 RepID=A0A848K7R6_9NOCA|nr:phage integrase family protein [Antrihabitans stalactiti]
MRHNPQHRSRGFIASCRGSSTSPCATNGSQVIRPTKRACPASRTRRADTSPRPRWKSSRRKPTAGAYWCSFSPTRAFHSRFLAGDRAGKPLRSRVAREQWFDQAVIDAGCPEDFTPHELRHTAASLAVSAGASVKGVHRPGYRSIECGQNVGGRRCGAKGKAP